jgi:hypothetical protein
VLEALSGVQGATLRRAWGALGDRGDEDDEEEQEEAAAGGGGGFGVGAPEAFDAVLFKR